MAKNNQCIDLMARFGDRFLVGPETSYVLYWGEGCEPPEPPPTLRDLRIDCAKGFIAPHGRDELVAVTSRPRAAKALKGLAFAKATVDAGATCAVFRVDDFEAVAAIMRPHPKSHPTQRDRAARRARRTGRRLNEGVARRAVACRTRREAKLAG